MSHRVPLLVPLSLSVVSAPSTDHGEEGCFEWSLPRAWPPPQAWCRRGCMTLPPPMLPIKICAGRYSCSCAVPHNLSDYPVGAHDCDVPRAGAVPVGLGLAPKAIPSCVAPRTCVSPHMPKPICPALDWATARRLFPAPHVQACDIEKSRSGARKGTVSRLQSAVAPTILVTRARDVVRALPLCVAEQRSVGPERGPRPGKATVQGFVRPVLQMWVPKVIIEVQRGKARPPTSTPPLPDSPPTDIHAHFSV